MSAETEQFDVVVIGGGPAGSTLSTLVARENKHKVLLVEKQKHPRYSIGESLLPATIHGIIPLLGLTEEIKEANFTRKLGGTFRWGANPEPWTFNFSRAPTLNDPTGYAYQVERSKFDHILLKNAVKNGVEVREETSVKEILFENGRAVGVVTEDKAGNQRTVRAKYVADTSGHTSNFYQKVGERVYSKFFQNIALFTYYENGKRLPPPQSGNILSAAFSDGWFWYIPLSPTLTSVGAVIAKDKAKLLQQEPEKAMQQFIDACPLIKEYLKDAKRVTEGPYGQFRIRKDYSYANTKIWMPGLVLAGDCACFVDPVISSGVHLATYGALVAARSINSCLDGTVDEVEAFEEYERRYRREYANFYTFLVGFYDMHKDENSYFWEARKVIGTPDQALQGFLRLVSGTTTGERVYASAEEFMNASKPLLADEGASMPAPKIEANENKTFMEDFDSAEIVQMMMQGHFGDKRPKEKPMRSGGLVPSRGGFHWMKPAAPAQPAAKAP